MVTKTATKVKKTTTKSPLTTVKPVSTVTLGKRKPGESKTIEKKEKKKVRVASAASDDEDEGEEDVKEVKKVKKVKGKEKAEFAENAAKRADVKVAKKPESKKVETKRTKETDKSESTAKAKAESKSSSKDKKKKKEPTPEPSESEKEDEDAGASEKVEEDEDKNEEGSDDEEVLLHGFSTESDSSDEDEEVDKAPIDVGKLPTVAKDDASVKKKLERAKKQASQERGVLYLGRIPHGFYEDQMRAYFSQFGDVIRIRLSRNKKTGASKHYGFIEFSSSAVAQIVAETMDNYLLMGHILRCKLIPKNEVHPELWVGANRKFRRVPADRVERQKQNKPRTEKEKARVERRLLKRQEEKKRKLQAAGIDYDFSRVGYKKIKQDA